MSNELTIVRGGALTTVQDLGRRGYAHLAVPRSGAVDVPAMTLANRLVGNPPDTAVLETTLTGAAFRVAAHCHVAVTGAVGAITVDGRAAGWAVPVAVRAGETVDVGRARHGVRSYIAVSGGIDVEPVLGSRSTDLLSGLGPPAVRTGAVLPVGLATPTPAGIDYAPYPIPSRAIDLACHLGPRDDRITAASIAELDATTWTVTPRSNRIALRLSGPALRWNTTEELQSEGVVLGSIQVPPDGQPVLFLADHPATGGYPVVGVVPEPDIWRCGQAVPGGTIRFHVRAA